MTFALGTDFSCVDDLDANLSSVSGRKCLAQAVARRLTTPTGGLFYAPDYGDDIRRYLHTNGPAETRVAAAVQGEAEKDERVDRADVTVALADGGTSLGIDVRLDDGDGPFDLTLNVSDLTTELLTEGRGS